MERAKRKETAASYESRTYFRSAKCKQNDSPVMHRGIWRKSSSCDDWFQWYQPTLALYQLERHIYYPSPPRLEQMLRCTRPIRTQRTQISLWILYYSIFPSTVDARFSIRLFTKRSYIRSDIFQMLRATLITSINNPYISLKLLKAVCIFSKGTTKLNQLSLPNCDL